MKYEDLKIWQKTMILVKDIYQETKKIPANERFGLIEKMLSELILSLRKNSNDT